jgi:hypothetical protein
MLALLGLPLVALPNVAQAEVPIPVLMRDSLTRNARDLGPLTLTWERTRRSELSTQEVLARIKYPKTAVEFVEPVRVRFAWQDDKYRVYYWRRVPQMDSDFKVRVDKPMTTQESEIAFDGNKFYGGTGLEAAKAQKMAPVLGIDSIKRFAERHSDSPIVRPDYFLHAGFRLPDRPADHLDPAAASVPLHLVRKGAEVSAVGSESVDGKEYDTLELRTPERRIRFHLDRDMSFAVRRRTEWNVKGELAVRCDCRDFVRAGDSGPWLPTTVTVVWHTWDETLAGACTRGPLFQETFRVQGADRKPMPRDHFVLKYDVPGTYVSDASAEGAERSKSGRLNYRIPANAEELDEVIRAAREGQGFTPRSAWARAPVIAVLVNVVLVAGLVGFYCWRRVSRRTPIGGTSGAKSRIVRPAHPPDEGAI